MSNTNSAAGLDIDPSGYGTPATNSSEQNTRAKRFTQQLQNVLRDDHGKGDWFTALIIDSFPEGNLEAHRLIDRQLQLQELFEQEGIEWKN